MNNEYSDIISYQNFDEMVRDQINLMGIPIINNLTAFCGNVPSIYFKQYFREL